MESGIVATGVTWPPTPWARSVDARLAVLEQAEREERRAWSQAGPAGGELDLQRRRLAEGPAGGERPAGRRGPARGPHRDARPGGSGRSARCRRGSARPRCRAGRSGTGRCPRPRGTRPSPAPGSRTRSLAACSVGRSTRSTRIGPSQSSPPDELERRRAGRRRQLVAEDPRADRRPSPRRARPPRRSARGAGRSAGPRGLRAAPDRRTARPGPARAQRSPSRLGAPGRSARTSSVNGSSRGASRRSPSPTPGHREIGPLRPALVRPLKPSRQAEPGRVPGRGRRKRPGRAGRRGGSSPRPAVRPQFQRVSRSAAARASLACRTARRTRAGDSLDAARPSSSGSWSTSAACWPIPGRKRSSVIASERSSRSAAPEPRDQPDRQGDGEPGQGDAQQDLTRASRRAGATQSRSDEDDGRRDRPGRGVERELEGHLEPERSGASAPARRGAAPAPREAIRVRRCGSLSRWSRSVSRRGRSDDRTFRPFGRSCAKSTRPSGPG